MFECPITITTGNNQHTHTSVCWICEQDVDVTCEEWLDMDADYICDACIVAFTIELPVQPRRASMFESFLPRDFGSGD